MQVFVSLALVVFSRGNFQKHTLVNTDVKSCASELMHILGYFTVLEKLFCETETFKTKALQSANTLSFVTYTRNTAVSITPTLISLGMPCAEGL